MTPTEENKAVVLMWYDMWNEHLDKFDDLYSPEWVGHFPGLELHGPQGHRGVGAAFLNAFPDAIYTVELIIAEGDLVASRYTMRATHLGQLQNIAPTGRSVVHTANNVHRIANGKIVEQWAEYDNQVLTRQLQ